MTTKNSASWKCYPWWKNRPNPRKKTESTLTVIRKNADWTEYCNATVSGNYREIRGFWVAVLKVKAVNHLLDRLRRIPPKSPEYRVMCPIWKWWESGAIWLILVPLPPSTRQNPLLSPKFRSKNHFWNLPSVVWSRRLAKLGWVGVDKSLRNSNGRERINDMAQDVLASTATAHLP